MNRPRPSAASLALAHSGPVPRAVQNAPRARGRSSAGPAVAAGVASSLIALGAVAQPDVVHDVAARVGVDPLTGLVLAVAAPIATAVVHKSGRALWKAGGAMLRAWAKKRRKADPDDAFAAGLDAAAGEVERERGDE